MGDTIIVSIIEEIRKFAIIIYFTRQTNSKFILNSLLIGATIGAGFAAFESAGYAFSFGSMYGENAMISVIFTRVWMSVGTHVVWSVIAGAVLVYVKGDHLLTSDTILDSKFLSLFGISITLHAVRI